MIILRILTATLKHFSVKGWETLIFECFWGVEGLHSRGFNAVRATALPIETFTNYRKFLRPSQLMPTQAKFTTSMELGIVCRLLGLSWLKLDRVGLNLSQVFDRLATSANSRQFILLLLCDYTRSYSENWMVSCKLARLGGIAWTPADASFDFALGSSWLELGEPFGHGFTNLKPDHSGNPPR